MGHFGGHADKADEPDLPSVRTQVQRMEAAKGIIPPAPSIPAPQPPTRPPNMPPPIPNHPPPPPMLKDLKAQDNQEIPAFYQKRHERDTFGIHQSQQNWNGSEISKDTYDSWVRKCSTLILKKIFIGIKNSEKFPKTPKNSQKFKIITKNFLFLQGRAEAVNFNKKDNKGEVRSRSRSRDREHFSESVWDRSEVEGAVDSRERKEREKHDRLYELKQVERERESQKVYQPSGAGRSPIEKAAIKKAPSPQQMHERATFKTHMAQRMTERKTSTSTQLTQSTDKPDDTDVEWSAPTPAPQPILPPSAKLPAAACLTYNRVPFKLRVRKEVFHPTEAIGSPATLDLLFAQVVGDVLNITPCLRVTPQEKRNAINLLGGHGVTSETVKNQQVRAIVKRHLIDMARGWPLYFTRLFTVSSSPQFPDVSLLVGDFFS